MKTIREWRKSLEITRIGFYPSGLHRLRWVKAGCGHWSPKEYIIRARIGISSVRIPRGAEACPQCSIATIRDLYAQRVAQAIPCARCGNPIWKNSLFGLTTFTWSMEPPHPILSLGKELYVTCETCADRVGGSIPGYRNDDEMAMLITEI